MEMNGHLIMSNNPIAKSVDIKRKNTLTGSTIGHNYRNGTFFSNNKNLAVGDILKIKDNSGRELIYKIYKKFETSENDTSFYNRDTGGVPEVTLSTCTDDVKARIIIQAKAEQ